MTERPPRSLGTPLTVAVLALLAEESRHPYELQATIRERGVANVVKMRGGSLYDAVSRLERAGLVERVGTDRHGARPERTVYVITQAGRDQLQVLMQEFLSAPVNEYPRFVAALAHLSILPPTEAATLLRKRADRLDDEWATADEQWHELCEGLPRLVLLEIEYTQRLRAVEIDWLREVATDIEQGQLPWPHDHQPSATRIIGRQL